MGTLSLLLPTPPPSGEIYFAGGYDLAPLPAEPKLSDSTLTFSRSDQDSGFVLAPWMVPDYGPITISSATLRQRPEPYRLSLELLRGKLNSLRNQTAEWSEIGLDLVPAFRTQLSDLNKRFGRIATDDDPTRIDAEATQCLGDAVALSDLLVETYTDQVFRTRHQSETKIRTAFGCRLTGSAPVDAAADEAYRRAFNAVRLQPNWADIEAHQGEFDWSAFDSLVGWALTSGLNVSIGPIIDLRPGKLPAWLQEWHGDWASIAAYACEFTELVMVRYGERIGIWQVVSGFNHSHAAGLFEDDRLRLAARLLDAARQIDKEGELIVGLCQPWGEYRSRPEMNYSPLLFADTLLRAGIRAAGFELDISETGDSPSHPRDALDVVRLLDNFGALGLPLEIGLGSTITPTTPSTERIARAAAVAACMPHVRGVFYKDWLDARTGLYPPAGPTPLLRRLESIRISHLS